MSSIAINVLLDPDAGTVEKAQAVNSRLRENYPDGFALDAHHAPHVTILQCFVKLADLDKVAHAVTAVLRTAEPMNWQSKATSFYDLAHENLGLVGIVIEPTDDLRRLQQGIIDAVAPFSLESGTSDAFASRPDGAAISQPIIDYVNNFMRSRTGIHYHPHLTVGIGTRHFVDALKAEPFEPFPFRAVAVSLYQVGDFGVAQRKLHELHSCRSAALVERWPCQAGHPRVRRQGDRRDITPLSARGRADRRARQRRHSLAGEPHAISGSLCHR